MLSSITSHNTTDILCVFCGIGGIEHDTMKRQDFLSPFPLLRPKKIFTDLQFPKAYRE